jgi:hypothetical protein
MAATMLLKKGASVEEKDIIGRTALKVAREYGHESVVAIISAQIQRDLAFRTGLPSPDPAVSVSYTHTIPNDHSQYTSLDHVRSEIRLLRIETFSPDNQITCSVVRTSLTDHPPFTALSYCWGSLECTTSVSVRSDDNQKIGSSWVNDGSESIGKLKTFSVTTNLFDALRSFKYHTDDVFIWNDMLCINQGSLLERSQQVSIMTKIYQAADSVTIWLGGDPDTETSVLHPEKAKDLDIFLTILLVHAPYDGASLVQQWDEMKSATPASDAGEEHTDEEEEGEDEEDSNLDDSDITQLNWRDWTRL